MAGCIFCGTSPTTRTHIFRKAWLEQIMPSAEPFKHRHERPTPEPFDRWWAKHKFDIAPNCTCQDCNGGWMDKIDRAGEALVERCVRGSPRTFKKPKEERALGRWITLVSILLDQTTPTQGETSTQRSHDATNNNGRGGQLRNDKSSRVTSPR